MAFWALLIFMVSTLAATIFAVLDHLREVPATLMMPRAPKAGKHVLLEHIPFIWKRLVVYPQSDGAQPCSGIKSG